MDMHEVSGESLSVNRSDKVIKGQAFFQKRLGKEARVAAVKSLVENAKTARNGVTSRMEHAQQWYSGVDAIEMCRKHPKSALIVGGILTVTGLGVITAGAATTGAGTVAFTVNPPGGAITTLPTAAGLVAGSVIFTAGRRAAMAKEGAIGNARDARAYYRKQKESKKTTDIKLQEQEIKEFAGKIVETIDKGAGSEKLKDLLKSTVNDITKRPMRTAHDVALIRRSLQTYLEDTLKKQEDYELIMQPEINKVILDNCRENEVK